MNSFTCKNCGGRLGLLERLRQGHSCQSTGKAGDASEPPLCGFLPQAPEAFYDIAIKPVGFPPPAPCGKSNRRKEEGRKSGDQIPKRIAVAREAKRLGRALRIGYEFPPADKPDAYQLSNQLVLFTPEMRHKEEPEAGMNPRAG